MRGIVSLAAPLITWALSFAASHPASAQELETETARLLKSGAIKGGAGFEYQTSADGSESAVPLFIEGGLHDRLELTIEPVAYARIRPRLGTHAAGPGDVEITLTGLAAMERSWLPAIALAAEVKVPTARKTSIGTGQYDFAGFLIMSKRFGRVDTHLNGGYTIIGRPPGANVSNIFSFAVAAKWYVTDRIDLFAEVLGNTAASPEAEATASAAAPAELTGGELVGTVGGGFLVVPWALVSLGVSYDNNQAVLIHPGVTLLHHLF
jgi:hypothetical protein